VKGVQGVNAWKRKKENLISKKYFLIFFKRLGGEERERESTTDPFDEAN